MGPTRFCPNLTSCATTVNADGAGTEKLKPSTQQGLKERKSPDLSTVSKGQNERKIWVMFKTLGYMILLAHMPAFLYDVFLAITMQIFPKYMSFV